MVQQKGQDAKQHHQGTRVWAGFLTNCGKIITVACRLLFQHVSSQLESQIDWKLQAKMGAAATATRSNPRNRLPHYGGGATGWRSEDLNFWRFGHHLGIQTC